MSQFLLHLHNAKEAHVSRVLESFPADSRRNFERLLTDAFIAGARAAVDGISDRDARIVADRLADMENERRRAQFPTIAVLPWVEGRTLIEEVTR